MRYLLDTQAFLMFLNQEQGFSSTAKQVLFNPKEEVIISVASFWEMAIKVNIGKLQLNTTLQEIIKSSVSVGGMRILPINVEHILGLETLPFHHRDPFDRLLVLQAKFEGLAIISGDRIFDQYGVDRIW